MVLAATTSNKKRISTANLDVDGSGYHVLPLPDRTLNLGPGAWSPDGGRLALAGWDDASKRRAGIYAVSSSNGGGIVRLTTSPDGNQDDPLAYSPDGSRLLFFHEQPPRQQGVPLFGPLFETTATGSGRIKLNPPGTQVTADFGSPASWSPDGKQITFTAFSVPASSGQSAVFVEDADGTHRRRITAWGEWSTSAHWSPDGAWIVFDKVQTGSTGPHNLFLVRPDGTGLRAITSTALGGVCCAVWSPDGAKLLFSPRGNLVTMNRDGTNLVRLTPFDGVPIEYAWAP
jgi:Tol biopolymer transport system component